jgi:phytoene synthase
MVADPRFAAVCGDLAGEASAGFAAVDAQLARLDRATLKPAILMMEGYRRIFMRLKERAGPSGARASASPPATGST